MTLRFSSCMRRIGLSRRKEDIIFVQCVTEHKKERARREMHHDVIVRRNDKRLGVCRQGGDLAPHVDIHTPRQTNQTLHCRLAMPMVSARPTVRQSRNVEDTTNWKPNVRVFERNEIPWFFVLPPRKVEEIVFHLRTARLVSLRDDRIKPPRNGIPDPHE